MLGCHTTMPQTVSACVCALCVYVQNTHAHRHNTCIRICTPAYTYIHTISTHTQGAVPLVSAIPKHVDTTQKTYMHIDIIHTYTYVLPHIHIYIHTENTHIQGAVPLVSAIPKHVTLHKTRLCREWVQTGTCQFQSACSFAHGRGELQRPQVRFLCMHICM